MSNHVDEKFRKRYWDASHPRPGDERDEYQRDKSRLVHSSAFRRLQAKTQVMGVGEGDFHRTRLTHSIEAAQIGEGLLAVLKRSYANDDATLGQWLPSRDLLAAACLAHDLGHPPFGHGGEIALHEQMRCHGGFEGNAQTLRILTRLEKYTKNKGMNPTRRFILAVLKYPMPYSSFDTEEAHGKPPKCYYDSEKDIVDWALGEDFTNSERYHFITEKCESNKPRHRTLDCSIMEYADDIAYAVHDLEDIVARGMVLKDDLIGQAQEMVFAHATKIGSEDKAISLDDFRHKLFEKNYIRKEMIGHLVNLFITSVQISQEEDFVHPLLKYRIRYDEDISALLHGLKNLTHKLVIERAGIQQLERRGQKIVDSLFRELVDDPSKLLPKTTWESCSDMDSSERRVCDYIAGMTDSFAEKVYRRLFMPGQGTSSEEL